MSGINANDVRQAISIKMQSASAFYISIQMRTMIDDPLVTTGRVLRVAKDVNE